MKCKYAKVDAATCQVCYNDIGSMFGAEGDHFKMDGSSSSILAHTQTVVLQCSIVVDDVC
jgi:hypothetical protein